MKIIVTGSLGNVGRILSEKLIRSGHDVTVVSHSAEREKEIASLGARAAIGSIDNSEFLAETFNGADAVFAMTPPAMGNADIIRNMTATGRAFAEAFERAGIRRVVFLSSVGADLAAGNGPIAGLYHIEQIFDQLPNVGITYLRAGYFFTNFFGDVPMIKEAGIMGANFSSSTWMPMVHPADVAAAAADELQKQQEGKNVRYLVTDFREITDVPKQLGAAVNMPDLTWVEFTDEQAMQGMLQAGLPEEVAAIYTELNAGLRRAVVQAHYMESGSPIMEGTKLEDFAIEFASLFPQSVQATSK